MNTSYSSVQLILANLFVMMSTLTVWPALADPQPQSMTQTQCEIFWNNTTAHKAYHCDGTINSTSSDLSANHGFLCKATNVKNCSYGVSGSVFFYGVFYGVNTTDGGDVCMINNEFLGARGSC